MDEVVALHGNCAACLARESGNDGVEATLVILYMLQDGVELSDIIHDLCFEHRRMCRVTPERA